jgi:hypothetical protein
MVAADPYIQTCTFSAWLLPRQSQSRHDRAPVDLPLPQHELRGLPDTTEAGWTVTGRFSARAGCRGLTLRVSPASRLAPARPRVVTGPASMPLPAMEATNNRLTGRHRAQHHSQNHRAQPERDRPPLKPEPHRSGIRSSDGSALQIGAMSRGLRRPQVTAGQGHPPRNPPGPVASGEHRVGSGVNRSEQQRARDLGINRPERLRNDARLDERGEHDSSRSRLAANRRQPPQPRGIPAPHHPTWRQCAPGPQPRQERVRCHLTASGRSPRPRAQIVDHWTRWQREIITARGRLHRRGQRLCRYRTHGGPWRRSEPAGALVLFCEWLSMLTAMNATANRRHPRFRATCQRIRLWPRRGMATVSTALLVSPTSRVPGQHAVGTRLSWTLRASFRLLSAPRQQRNAGKS